MEGREGPNRGRGRRKGRVDGGAEWGHEMWWARERITNPELGNGKVWPGGGKFKG